VKPAAAYHRPTDGIDNPSLCGAAVFPSSVFR
jgi:hypothetical protein